MGEGNISVHSHKERRYRCATCGKTFSARKGTVFDGLRTAEATVTCVLTLLAWGCPPQAIVHAFGLDERTVADWQSRAGSHCQQVHERLVAQQGLDLKHVQADELRVKIVGGVVWLACALMVPTRLWLGGVLSATRDKALIVSLMQKVRACALGAWRPLLVCVDGLAAYVTAVAQVFRERQPTGGVGRPRLLAWEQLALGQVIKQRVKGRVVGVTRRLVRGSAALAQQLLVQSRGGKDFNTAFIERLNATLRAHLSALTRRGRAIAHQIATLESGMWLVGCAYNWCWTHDHLRLRQPEDSARRWQERTPAMAAGLTDHVWTMDELLRYQVPLPPLPARKRRGRPPKIREGVVAV